MVVLRIGEAIVNEQMFIGIDLKIEKGETDMLDYIYTALWNRGDRVADQDIHYFSKKETDIATGTEINNGFKDAMTAIRWDEFSEI